LNGIQEVVGSIPIGSTIPPLVSFAYSSSPASRNALSSRS
jgi:hypothetical protein